MNQRWRTVSTYNLDILNGLPLSPGWEMPVIRREDYLPSALIGLNEINTAKATPESTVHFFLDDYQFERLWTRPRMYADMLSRFACVLSPDYSLYMDMPAPLKIWNTYRSRTLGAYYQARGIRVIPTISWAGPESFTYCFVGIERGGTVAVSTVGVVRDASARRTWRQGADAMVKALAPKRILIYGKQIEFDARGAEVVTYQTRVPGRWSADTAKETDGRQR